MADETPQVTSPTNPTDGTPATAGVAMSPAHAVAPALQPTPWATAGSARPPHSHTESTLAPTSEYVRIFLLLWIVRYIPRGISKFVFGERTVDWVKKPINMFLQHPTEKYANRIMGVLDKYKHLPEVEHFLSVVKEIKPEHELTEVGRKAVANKLAEAIEPLQKLQTADGKGPYQEIYQELRRTVFRPLQANASVDVSHALMGIRAAEHHPNKLMSKVRSADKKWTLSEDYFGRVRNLVRATMDDMAYSLLIGLGSAGFSIRYSMLVRQDIKNLFSEAVAYEKDIPVDKVTFKDISQSDNTIIQQTVHNYWKKLGQRLATDGLFFAAVPLKNDSITDVLLGVKGYTIVNETWNRKTTMFEDVISFVNSKINPRNGLGQPIGTGEVFDLYQHYMETSHPDKAFSNVIAQGGEEGLRWAKAQPIFQRMTELMNQTYAYKHATVIDPQTGTAVQQADFALPKFIYMLGHDLIDPHLPEQTMALIEIANARGIPAVKEAQKMLASGINLNEVIGHYQVNINAVMAKAEIPTSEKNGVIAKGSTIQLDAAPQVTRDHPVTKISVETIRDHSLPDKLPSLQAAT